MTDSAFLADAPILLDAPDGRLLEVRLAGPEDGFPLVHHHGTPQAAWPFPARTSCRTQLQGAALDAAAGLQQLRQVDADRLEAALAQLSGE